ncbi:uncharacterized protein LOC134207123 [Armigeres subalbatus]|uniref:uncharacterized protein LOC134207123 n=1 Tax=Armigeres subalbatus TaxID=124917 RepID=UPI002ED5F1FA
MVCSKVDGVTLRFWESSHNSKEVPTYRSLVTFLKNHCAVLQSVEPNKATSDKQKKPKISVSHPTIATDPHFYQSSSIDMIIGAEYYLDLLQEGRFRLSEEGPTFQNTVFGWIVSESKCEEIFKQTTTRDEEGRFVVCLPKKRHIIEQLGESRRSAERRFISLERRFATNPQLKKLYCEFMEEYSSMGHMKEVSDAELSGSVCYYLPHHAVLKLDSTTTKLRVVFDASCKTTSGASLNDGLMVGPVVQDDLISI